MQLVTNLFYQLGWDLTWWTLLLAAAELLALITIPSVLIQRRGQPLAALAWVLGLMAVPFAGVLVWWGIGRSRLERKRRRRASARWAIARGFASLRPQVPELTHQQEEKLLPIRRLPLQESWGVFPAVHGNRVQILVDGAQTYEALDAIARGARHHLHFLFYTWEPDAVGRRFRDLLADRARAGIEVRVLCDAVGSSAARRGFFSPLEEAGGRVSFFMPPRFLGRGLTVNFRNHRKLAVADGGKSYVGGLNIGEAYTGAWRDAGFLLEGPVSAQLQEVFADDWFFCTGENLADSVYLEGASLVPGKEGEAYCRIIAGGPDNPYNATHDACFIAISRARERVWLTTPYLIPSQAIETALRTAVYRGVDVRLLVPHRSDVPLAQLAGRSFYPSLLSAGIRIFEYLPAVLHSKVWLFDDDLSVIGSANLDSRSFRLNFEISCFTHSDPINAALAVQFESHLAQSREVSLLELSRASKWQQLKEAAMNLFSPLL